MELVTGAMNTLLPKLADLIKEEYKLQKSVRAEITILSAELEYMEAALLKFAEAPIDQPPDPLVKLWERDVREMSYDLEDSIDDFMVRIENHAPTKAEAHSSFMAFLDRSMDLLRRAKIRRKIGVDIKEYKRRIKEVKERSDRYNKAEDIPAKPPGPSLDNLRLSALYIEATKLVGSEQRSDDLVKMLMEGDNASKHRLKMVSIFGFGGLGKTTLARIVYEKLRGQFECGVFVTVSHSPNLKNIFKKMLQGCGFSSKYDDTWDVEQRIDELRKFLRAKRYFIVIDDIWETAVLETIQYALIHNERGSRVICTTRILDVAQKVGDVYRLKPLSHADSRKLFHLRIFDTEENSVPDELAEVSKKILKKCGGMPLAILMVGGMLANQKETQYWSKVHQTLGSGLGDSPDIKGMRRLLLTSYYYLPRHLKACMLYLSSYPEDHEIHTGQLIWKWIGEGFIPEKKGKSIYEVGEEYIDDLMNRSMIQLVHTKFHSEKPGIICVHDMVLDLITHLSNEDGFLTTLLNATLLDAQRSIHLKKTKIRRLSLQTSKEEVVKLLPNVGLNHVRSLTISPEACDSMQTLLNSFLPKALLTLEFLRLLDLKSCKGVDNHYFKSICNLFHLRYLGLSTTSITEIPEQIRNLQSLQILDVTSTQVRKLPSAFNQLRQLLCLHFESLKQIPVGFGDLKHLQELYGMIIVEYPTMIHDLFELIELRSLDLQFNAWDERYQESFLKCLSSLVKLECLNLRGCNGDLGSRCERLIPVPQQLRIMYITYVDNIVRSVPRWMSSLCALSILHINLLTLGEDDLYVLGHIPCLSKLDLYVEEPTQGRYKKLVITNAYPFLCLTKFGIHKHTGVAFSQGAMPKLQTLVLVFGARETLDKFGNFEFGLENLSSLVNVKAKMGFPGGRNGMKGAEDAIRNALDMNPNKPALDYREIYYLTGDVCCEGYDSKIIKEILTANRFCLDLGSIDPKPGKVTVYSEADPTKIIEKLNKAGIVPQWFSYYYG